MNNSVKVTTIIQARTTSSRLPNKTMLPLAGKTVLSRLIERVMAAELTGEIVIATTTDRSDDAIQELCLLENIDFFRGHPSDLLDRHFRAASRYKSDAVVKIPSDCPLIDPEVIDRVIEFYLMNHSRYDYVSNLHPATYPDGNDVEIMSMEVLRTAWKEAKRGFEREHTTPFIWENPHKFRIGNVLWETGLDYSMTHRFTLDYAEDYEFISRVYDDLYENNLLFNLKDILELMKRKPELGNINRKYLGVNWYRHHLGELKTIDRSQTKLTGDPNS